MRRHKRRARETVFIDLCRTLRLEPDATNGVDRKAVHFRLWNVEERQSGRAAGSRRHDHRHVGDGISRRSPAPPFTKHCAASWLKSAMNPRTSHISPYLTII